MSQEAVEKFLGRLLTDGDFRDYARDSFAGACLAEGFHFSKEEAGIMEKLDLDWFVVLSEQLDGGIKRSNAAHIRSDR